MIRNMRHYGKMHFVVVAALLLTSVASSSACPDFCTCENGEVQCREAELLSIPEGLGDDTVVLDLSYNNITVISGQDFKNMPMLKTIIIADSYIEKIQPEAFLGLQQLEILDLHSNSIDSLHSSVFQENLNLVNLDLSDNSLETFECDLSPKIEFLNLSKNHLTSESVTSFSIFTSLVSLDISHNKITNISGDIFSAMVDLKHLDISVNQLEYDCNLKPLWILCRNRSINCVVEEEEESWKMLENFNCGDDEEVAEEEATTPETEGFLPVMNSVSENETSSNGDEEGSGAEVPNPNTDLSPEDTTAEVTEEQPIMDEENWIMIVIIVCVVLVIALVIAVVVLCIRRHRRLSVGTGNLSRSNSLEYDQFQPSYMPSRNDSVKKTESKMRINNFDRVLNTPDYSKPEPNRDVIPLGDYTSAEVVRQPSFKTQGVSTPLNLPEEISVSSRSLPRPSPASSYDDSTLRAGSLRRFPKSEHGAVPDIQMIQGVRRVPSNKATIANF